MSSECMYRGAVNRGGVLDRSVVLSVILGGILLAWWIGCCDFLEIAMVRTNAGKLVLVAVMAVMGVQDAYAGKKSRGLGKVAAAAVAVGVGMGAGYAVANALTPRATTATGGTGTMAGGAGPVAGGKECENFFVGGKRPEKAVAEGGALKWGSQRFLCFSGFAVMHSGQTKTPLYVAEVLTPETLADAKDEERTNKFYAEARLPAADRATLEDYAGSGFDRGHMFPAADSPTAEVMAQSFSLANMVPQTPELNRGPWAKSVEIPTRQYVKRLPANSQVYVITGPLFGANPQPIKAGSTVLVPAKTFKLVYDAGKRKAWAFVLDNTSTPKMGKPISMAELKAATGVNWMPGAVEQ